MIDPLTRLRRSLSNYSYAERLAIELEPTAGFIWFDSKHDADMIAEANELVKEGYLQPGQIADFGEESQYSQLRFYYTEKVLELLQEKSLH